MRTAAGCFGSAGCSLILCALAGLGAASSLSRLSVVTASNPPCFVSLPDLFGLCCQLEPWAVVSLLQQWQRVGLGAAELGAGLCRPL